METFGKILKIIFVTLVVTVIGGIIVSIGKSLYGLWQDRKRGS